MESTIELSPLAHVPPLCFSPPFPRARYNALPADVKAAANANAGPLHTDAADFQPSKDVNVLQQQASMVRRGRWNEIKMRRNVCSGC